MVGGAGGGDPRPAVYSEGWTMRPVSDRRLREVECLCCRWNPAHRLLRVRAARRNERHRLRQEIEAELEIVQQPPTETTYTGRGWEALLRDLLA